MTGDDLEVNVKPEDSRSEELYVVADKVGTRKRVIVTGPTSKAHGESIKKGEKKCRVDGTSGGNVD